MSINKINLIVGFVIGFSVYVIHVLLEHTTLEVVFK